LNELAERIRQRLARLDLELVHRKSKDAPPPCGWRLIPSDPKSMKFLKAMFAPAEELLRKRRLVPRRFFHIMERVRD